MRGSETASKLKLLSLRLLLPITAFALFLLLSSTFPIQAAPRLQEEDIILGPLEEDEDVVGDDGADIGITGQVARDLVSEQRGVFTLLHQAERVVAFALEMIERDPAIRRSPEGLGIEEEVEGVPAAGQEEEVAAVEGDVVVVDEFRILLPSTRILLSTSYEILGNIEEGLEEYELLVEEDIAEELLVDESLLEEVDVEEGGDESLLEEEAAEPEEGDVDLVGEEEIPEGIDPGVNIVSSRCGDLDTLVAVARADMVRALGFRRRFGGELEEDPDARLLAIDALREHHQEMRQSLNCLSIALPALRASEFLPLERVPLEALTGSEDLYVGRRIWTVGEVEDVLSPVAFTLESEEFLRNEVLVISAEETGFDLELEALRFRDVLVIGTVVEWEVAVVEEELGFDLADERYEGFEGGLAIVAEVVEAVSSDVADALQNPE